MDPPLVEQAVSALMKHVRAKDKNSLTDTDSKVMLQIAFKKIPSKPKHPVALTLENSMYPKNPSVCLITKDPQRFFKDLVNSQNLPVERVIGISKLKKKFKEFELKRVLCDTYDVFMVDERIVPILPRWLGSYFYRKGKVPLHVKLNKKDVSGEINRALKSFMITSIGKGSCVCLPCGRVSFENEQLIENIHSAVKQLCAKLKPGMKNIQAVYIKTDDSVALPIYNSAVATKFKI